MSTGQPEPNLSHPAALSAGLPLRLYGLKKRSEFLAAARAPRIATPGFVLQARKRDKGSEIRVGFTCSKKVGNSVARNRAKRRLRALARLVLPTDGHAGTDYVLIGRAGKPGERDFKMMQDDLRRALRKLSS